MWRRLMLLSVPLVLGLGIYHSGLWRDWSPETARSALEGLGVWGPALFVVAFGLGNGLGTPGFVFLMPAIALWPVPVALGLVWLGALCAGCVGFVFARTLGRDWVARHLPENLRHLDERIAEKGLQTVIFVRITMFLLGPSHWALGLTAIRPAELLLGSAVGFLPPAVLWTVLGGDLMDAIQEGRPTGLITLGVLLGVAVLAPRWLTRAQQHRD